MTRFVVDGGHWRFDAWSGRPVAEALEALVDRIEVALERDEQVAYGEDLFNDPVLGALTLWELFSPSSPLPLDRDLQVRLSAVFDRLARWADGPDWPETFDVEVEGATSANPDVAFAHARVVARAPVACLGLHALGPRPVTCYGQTVTVHWVTDEASHVAFFRAAVDVEGDNADTVERLAAHAWPTLYFHPGTWTMGDFAGGYPGVRPALRRSLDALADHGCWIFTDKGSALRPGDPETGGRPPDIVQRRFIAHGMDVAPENGDVRGSARCRTPRECRVGGQTLYCHWHVKLQPHQNRIYLHPPVPDSGNRVVIARFHRHLPLPGDL